MDNFKSRILNDLSRRGLVKDCTQINELDILLCSEKSISVYAGFDPTASSLHVGHLASIEVLRAFAENGHRTIAVIGTATALVGDPSGRHSARALLDEATIERNARGIEESIRRGLGDYADRVEFRRNSEWLSGAGWIGFLREVGSLVAVQKILSLESVRTRLDGEGMSFLELAYPLMQAFDFLTLSREVGALVQIGGSDQWGNICTGLDLIARADNTHTPVFGLTHPLITNKDGTKMGKSANGAIWLNPSMLSDFEFFQFWRTLPDEVAPVIAGTLCERSFHENDVMDTNPEMFKQRLAFALTTRIRGLQAAQNALQGSCNRGKAGNGLPEFSVLPEQACDLANAAIIAGLTPSRAAARRLAVAGGLKVNGQPRNEMTLSARDFIDGVAVVSVGKTRHAAIRIRQS